jgi:uncharacterized protein (TIGR03579 family)
MEKKTFMDKLNDFLMKDNSFILIIGVAAASIFAGTYMFISLGTGSFSTISVAALLTNGLETGDFSAAAAFSAGFLIARVLEGPLVGLLDIGGSLMTGVGVGIPALLLSFGIKAPLSSLPLALLTGLGIGLVMGIVIMLIRKFMPKGIAVGGADIMMGAGNATGRWLTPLIVISAAEYSPWAGIGSIVGAALCYKYHKEPIGGAILGAMILGAIFLPVE